MNTPIFLKKAFLVTLLICSSAAPASAATLSLGVGYEHFNGFQEQQGQNSVLARAAVGRYFGNSASGLFGLELAALTGYTGLLELSEAMQDAIGGPSVVASSSPRLELLASLQSRPIVKDYSLITRFGVNASVLNFQRCDIDNALAVNLIGNIGVAKELSTRSKVLFTVGGSYPTTRVNLDKENRLSIKTPYPGVNVTVTWQTTL